MPSSQAVPGGSSDYIGIDYLSAKSALTDLTVRTLAGTDFFAFDMTSEGIKVDLINEYTSAAGVTIDSVVVKDSSLTVGHDVYIKGTNSSAAPFDILKVNSSNKIEFGNEVTAFTWTDASAARTAMGVAIGSDVQAYDADLAAIAALAKTDGNIIVGNGTAWVAESGATARTSLGVAIGSDVQAYDARLSDYASGTKESWSFPFAYSEVASFNGGFDYGLPASWADVQTKINQLGANIGNALNTLAGQVYLANVISGTGAYKP